MDRAKEEKEITVLNAEDRGNARQGGWPAGLGAWLGKTALADFVWEAVPKMDREELNPPVAGPRDASATGTMPNFGRNFSRRLELTMRGGPWNGAVNGDGNELNGAQALIFLDGALGQQEAEERIERALFSDRLAPNA